jgi:ClpP class serine protease
MKHPLIMEEIGRHSWACTEAALDGILRAVASGLGPDDETIFHAALGELRAEFGAPADVSEYNHGEKIGNVGVVRVEGPIVPYASAFTRASGVTSVSGLSADLEAMASDASISRIAMVFDSPGGATTGISELASHIGALGKPVVGYVYGMAASAAYWIASACDEIISANTGMVGSIGTVMTVASGKDADRVKIVSSQSPRKHADPETDEGRAHYQEIVDAMSDIFIDTVAANRNTDREDVLENYGRGGMVMADAAVSAGMVDGVSTFRSFMSAFSSPDWSAETISGKRSGNRVDASEASERPLKHEAAVETAPEERKESMNLNEFLASNPEAKREIDELVAQACGRVIAEHRERTATAAKVASCDTYALAIRNMAVQVLAGTAEPAALAGAMAVFEMTNEQHKSAEAAAVSASLPETPAQKNETPSNDGMIRSESDFRAAVERAKGKR